MVENPIDDKNGRLISHLQEMRRASHLQIHRNEIAAWTAAVLYLGILLAFSKVFLTNGPAVRGNDGYTIFLWVLLALFLYFVFSLYSGIHEQSAFIRAYDECIFKLFQGPESLNLTMDDGETIPRSILKSKEDHRKREGFVLNRPFLFIEILIRKTICGQKNPFKHKNSNQEVREGIIYDILCFVTGALWYLFLK